MPNPYIRKTDQTNNKIFSPIRDGFEMFQTLMSISKIEILYLRKLSDSSSWAFIPIYKIYKRYREWKQSHPNYPLLRIKKTTEMRKSDLKGQERAQIMKNSSAWSWLLNFNITRKKKEEEDNQSTSFFT